MDPGFGFSSSSKPAGGPLRPPRLAKHRKPMTGNRPNLFRSVSQSGAKPTFEHNQQNAGHGHVFRSNDGFVNNNLEEEMRRMKIDSEMGYSNGTDEESSNVHSSGRDQSFRGIDESVVSELPEDMRRLCIESERFSKLSGGIMEELPYKMKKLNAEDGSTNSSYDRSDRKSLGGSADVLLTEKMKSFKIEDPLSDSVNANAADVSSRGENAFVFEFSGNADQPVGLNRTNAGSDGSDHLKTKTSDVENMDDVPARNLGNVGSDNSSGLFGSRFTFQAELKSENSGTNLKFMNERSTTSFPMFSSSGIHHTPLGGVPEMPSVDGGDRPFGFGSSSKLDNMQAQNVEFKTPDPRAHSLFGMSRKLDAKRDPVKDTALRKKKGKSKTPTQVPLKFNSDFVFQETMHQNTESSEQYSPMDFSPYEETLASNTYSRETSVASEESSCHGENNSSVDSYPNVSCDIADEVLVSATERMHINEYDIKDNEGQDRQSASRGNDAFSVDSHEEDAISGAETESFKSAADELDYSTDSFYTTADTEVSSSYKIERQDSDGGTQFEHSKSSPDIFSGGFTFAASSASFKDSSQSMRIPKKKTRSKHSFDSFSSTPSAKVLHGTSHPPSFQVPGSSFSLHEQGQKDSFSTLLKQKSDKFEQVLELATKQDNSTAATIAAQESCEKWRLRGNQAYAKGDFSKAEDYYTQGVNCISQNETSRSCLRALMLCYSNRAATRMSLGRLRDALEDCRRATELDPSFLKVQARAAR